MDWAGLLKWSLQHTDGTVDGHIAEEDRHFLQEAIKHAMSQVRDPHEAVIEALEQLKSEDVTVQLAGLSIVNKCLDEAPEVSRNLAKYADKGMQHRLGAVAPLFTCLQSSDPHVVELVLDVRRQCSRLSCVLHSHFPTTPLSKPSSMSRKGLRSSACVSKQVPVRWTRNAMD